MFKILVGIYLANAPKSQPQALLRRIGLGTRFAGVEPKLEVLEMQKMTLWGIGPTLALVTLTYAAATAVLSQGKAEFAIDIVPRNGLVATGIALIVAGAVMYLASAKTIINAFGAGQLVTKGAYRLCRHPLYASWILFVFPGVELLLGSWLGLTTPLVMYLVFRTLISREEQYLRAKFGEPYLDYQKRVPLILPLGWLRGAP